MGSDSADIDPSSSAVSLDSIPVPVVGYDISDEEAIIVETNDPFESRFDSVSPGTAVQQWLHGDVGGEESRVADVCSSLVEGKDIDVEFEVETTDARTSEQRDYRLRTFEDSETGGELEGHFLVTTSRPEGNSGAEVDRIASVISHDLRNPLDVANAHLRAARETGAEEHFDEVRQSHDRMEQIIQDVLTLARGKNVLSITPDVDIGEVAADAWTTVDTREASLTIEDGLPKAEADPDRLQRLFENLFRNSVEHAHPTESGDTAADEQADSGDSDNPLQVRVGSTSGGFFVADNGMGIPEEDRTRVFDPGYSSTETGSGTGLGLTIVEEIAEAHDWNISITTGSLDGAQFEFQPLSNT